MLLAPIILFALAAVGGVTLAALRLENRSLPPPLALIHGILAAAGLIALIIIVAMGAKAAAVVAALILFIVAALGGFVLVSFHFRGKVLPVPLMLVHGVVAAAGFVLLVVHAIR